ncbi:AAA family ATPase [Chryseobacterium sp. CCH4-E10]|uniref:AAA family ATPase n=1 Tax=Chryseobacterium sp. CCH4-E10 TaxID=1768758 RepID=UPI00082A9E8D|nr:AAA family ATPase [Chryseobacterium sp. CCH4-E10]
MDILINKDTTAIVKKAKLKNLPDFIVLTGENGTGKSQFLAYLYLQVADTIVNEEEIMIDGIREIYSERGEISYEDNREIYIPNVRIVDGGKELNKITFRTTHQFTVDLGNSVDLTHLLKQGQNFAHKYLFYANLRNHSNSNIDQTLEDITYLNRKFLEETGYVFNSVNTGNIANNFSIKDKELIEVIRGHHENVDYELLRYYYIAYLPVPSSNVFSINIGYLFLQHWARKKIGIEVKESPLDIFNQIATEAKFRYTLQEPTIAEDTQNINLMMIDGETGNVVDINHLSSGEKVILSLVLAIYSSNIDTEFPEIILFDEPDAHLHPSLSKYMLDVLQNVFVKSKGIKVIMSTHSPSTVAFAPENSLYKMDRSLGYITKTNQKEAVELLSNGFLTFEEGIETFNLLKKSSKSTIVCVEGKTDITHINIAMEKLEMILDIELVNLHDAGSLASFIRSIPASILDGKKVVGIFDNDREGRSNYDKVKGEEIENYKILTSEQSKGQLFVACLPSNDNKLDKYCPIEYLYSKEILDKNDMLILRNFSEFKDMYKSDEIIEDQQLNTEYQECSTLRAFKVRDDNKTRFSESVKDLPKDQFTGFSPLLHLLDSIIKK